MKTFVDKLEYDNRDIGGAPIDYFWLSGNLLLTDVRGFSGLTDELPEERIVELLNAFFERMLDFSQPELRVLANSDCEMQRPPKGGGF